MENEHDAYKPAQIAALIESAGVAKARLPFGQMLTLAVLAGAYSVWTLIGAGLEAAGWGAVLLLAGLPVYWIMRPRQKA